MHNATPWVNLFSLAFSAFRLPGSVTCCFICCYNSGGTAGGMSASPSGLRLAEHTIVALFMFSFRVSCSVYSIVYHGLWLMVVSVHRLLLTFYTASLTFAPSLLTGRRNAACEALAWTCSTISPAMPSSLCMRSSASSDVCSAAPSLLVLNQVLGAYVCHET